MRKTRTDKKTRIGKLVVFMRELEGLTFKKIGMELGFSKQRAYQIFLEYKDEHRKNDKQHSEL